MKFEGVLRCFTAKINCLQSLTYWERLRALKIYFLQRRREIYLIIYVYKIIVGAVKNLSSCKFQIKTYVNSTQARLCIVPPKIEAKLDKVLAKIRDQPPLRGYTQQAASNCIVDQLAVLRSGGVFYS